MAEVAPRSKINQTMSTLRVANSFTNGRSVYLHRSTVCKHRSGGRVFAVLNIYNSSSSSSSETLRNPTQATHALNIMARGRVAKFKRPDIK